MDGLQTKLFVFFFIIQFEVIQALYHSLDEGPSAFISVPVQGCLNGKCSRVGSEHEEKSGFLHSIWAIFIFSLLGIFTFVAIFIFLLRVVCSTTKESKNNQEFKSEQITPSKPTFRDTPTQREITPAQHSTFDEEAQIDEIYARPNKNYTYPAETAEHAREVIDMPMMPQPSGQKRIVKGGMSQNVALAPILPARTSTYPIADISQYNGFDYTNEQQPFQYLDKYSLDQEAGIDNLSASAPPRAVLRISTPYKVVEQRAHLLEDNAVNEPKHLQQQNVRFDTPPPMHSHLPNQQPIMYDGPNRFVRVLPRELPLAGALKPSPVFRRKF